MSQGPSSIQRPTPVSADPIPEIPEHLRPTPAPLGVTTARITGRTELGVVFKATYRFDDPLRPQWAEQQLPLARTNVAHEELVPGVAPSMKEVPELLGFCSGTDIVIRGHARPARPTATMQVGVVVGRLRHVAQVSGRRLVDRSGSRLVFTAPEPFEAMPLRYELAYGGIDRDLEHRVSEALTLQMKPEELRRLHAVGRDHLQGVPPVAYPRNPYGKGFSFGGDSNAVLGKELPNVELDGDLLTPDRLWPPRPLQWPRQPLPAGFDYMDVTMYPRTAMMGLPPLADADLDGIAEVVTGQVPRGFSRGNVLYAEREEIPDLIHPELARCAPIGLRSAFLRGNESVNLYGMDPARPEFALRLPGVQPIFALPMGEGGRELVPQLYHIFVDVDERTLSLLWGARIPWDRPLMPGEDLEIASHIRVYSREV